MRASPRLVFRLSQISPVCIHTTCQIGRHNMSKWHITYEYMSLWHISPCKFRLLHRSGGLILPVESL